MYQSGIGEPNLTWHILQRVNPSSVEQWDYLPVEHVQDLLLAGTYGLHRRGPRWRINNWTKPFSRMRMVQNLYVWEANFDVLDGLRHEHARPPDEPEVSIDPTDSEPRAAANGLLFPRLTRVYLHLATSELCQATQQPASEESFLQELLLACKTRKDAGLGISHLELEWPDQESLRETYAPQLREHVDLLVWE